MEEEEWSCEELGHLYKRDVVLHTQSKTCYFCGKELELEQDYDNNI